MAEHSDVWFAKFLREVSGNIHVALGRSVHRDGKLVHEFNIEDIGTSAGIHLFVTRWRWWAGRKISDEFPKFYHCQCSHGDRSRGNWMNSIPHRLEAMASTRRTISTRSLLATQLAVDIYIYICVYIYIFTEDSCSCHNCHDATCSSHVVLPMLLYAIISHAGNWVLKCTQESMWKGFNLHWLGHEKLCFPYFPREADANMQGILRSFRWCTEETRVMIHASFSSQRL